jgi:hypothetical protein
VPVGEVPEIPAEPAVELDPLPAALVAAFVPSLLHDVTRVIKHSGPIANERFMG